MTSSIRLMPQQKAKAVQKAQMTAVVRRADGTVENLGVIAQYDANPIRRLWARVRGLGRIHT